MSNARIQRRKRLEKWAADRFIHLMFALVSRLPLRAVRGLGAFLGCCYYHLIGVHRRMAINNLRRAFPELPDREVAQRAKQVCIQFGKSSMEFLRIPTMTSEEIERTVAFEGEEHLQEALRRGKGVLLITAHFGNWELMGSKLLLHGYPVNSIARNSELPSTTTIINRIREGSGMRVFARGEVLSAVRVLKNNQILAILPDQHDFSGIFVDFFGIPAKTASGPAAIALRTGAAVLTVFAFRDADDSIRVVFSPPFHAEPTGDKEADIHALTQHLSNRIQDAIRQAPAQWLWIHNIWKSKPPVSPPAEPAIR